MMLCKATERPVDVTSSIGLILFLLAGEVWLGEESEHECNQIR